MHNQADAEDTVQDIFLRAYGGLCHFRGDSAFYSWLHRIAVNSAKTAHKARVRNSRRFSVRAESGDDSAEVASAMSCPVGTVRSRVFRARQAIDFQLRRVFDDGLGRARK